MTTFFISYKHENSEHRRRVLAFARDLVAEGARRGITLEGVLDQDIEGICPGGPSEGWEIWSENRAAEADVVLLIASRGYQECYNLRHPAGTAPGAIPEIFVIRKRIRSEGYAPNTVRCVVLAPGEQSFIPDALSHLKFFRPNESSADLRDIVGWMLGGIRPSGTMGGGAGWFISPPSFDGWYVADCEPVRDAFAQILVDQSQYRILLVKGHSGLGKSTLTNELVAMVSQLPDAPTVARFDLKGASDLVPPLEPFARQLQLTSELLGTEQLPAIDRLRKIFMLLEQRGDPTVLVFDTFESGGACSRWVEDQILPTAVVQPWLRVLVAGKEIPNRHLPNFASWRNAAREFELRRLPWEEWKPLAARLRAPISDEDLRTVCSVAKGDHAAIHVVLLAAMADT